jgi:hypothetical protein
VQGPRGSSAWKCALRASQATVFVWAALTAAPGAGQPLSSRAVLWTDFSVAGQDRLVRAGFGAASFDSRRDAIERETAARLSVGELDHLIHFVLQSRSFTSRPRIEPALSAREFVKGLVAPECKRLLEEGEAPPSGRMPRAVAERLDDFARALEHPGTDERLAYFSHLVGGPDGGRPDRLYPEYARAMRFLYRKEFLAPRVADRRRAVEAVTTLYQKRGHSSDTQLEVGFTVHEGLSILKALDPVRRVRRVLIVGPGLDLAPRTDLVDAFPPQSPQPFTVADSLLGLGLAAKGDLSIHCVDINPRVVSHLQRFPAGQRRLHLYTGISDQEIRPLAREYREYLAGLGASIGAASPIGPDPRLPGRLLKEVTVDAALASRMTADELNVVTRRYEPSPNYDLVVVTNVFPYFDEAELLLALANLSAMTAPGGILLHNELRGVLDILAVTVALEPLQARSVLIASGREGDSLYDAVALYRKSLVPRREP